MIASTQIANTEIFAFIAILVFELLSRKVLLVNFTAKLLQSYKLLECKIVRILLKHVSDHLSVLSQFA